MLVNILKEQIRIFEGAIILEKEKRQSILEAKGLQLEKLLAKSEQYMLKLENLDKALLQESRSFLGMEKDTELSPTLGELLEYSRKNNLKQSHELEKLTEKYRKLASQLKNIVQANQELLNNTKQRIQSLLQNLQAEEKSLFAKAYSPVKQKGSVLSQADSKLLNTGA